MVILSYILVGLFGGLVGGILGLGGGAIMVPAFVLLFGLTQHQAQGTSLAVMLPPIFLFAVLRYYWAGHVKVQMAVFVAIGFVIGAFLGADLAQSIPDGPLKRTFGVFLVIIGIKMIMSK